MGVLHNFTRNDKAPKLSHFSQQRLSRHAEDILDIAIAIQNHPVLENYMVPHYLVLAARVRLFELRERRAITRVVTPISSSSVFSPLGGTGVYKMSASWPRLGTTMIFTVVIDKLAAQAACIRDGDMVFSEPLTVFEPLPKHDRKLTRQQLVRSSESLSTASPRGLPISLSRRTSS